MDLLYPLPGFHFLATFLHPLLSTPLDASFQSVGGLEVSMSPETYNEGGENRFAHALPTRQSYPNLVLKRGLKPLPSPLANWCLDCLHNFNVVPVSVAVSLLGPDHEPLRVWNIVGAWPVKWSLSEFNAEQGQIVVETLELKYRYFTQVLPPVVPVNIPLAGLGI
jgi:phage tail-like protein